MKKLILAFAAGLSLATATKGMASPVTFEFSFGNHVDEITGEIEGLENDGLGQSPSSITIRSPFETYIISAEKIFFSNFDVMAGVIDLETIELYSDRVPGLSIPEATMIGFQISAQNSPSGNLIEIFFGEEISDPTGFHAPYGSNPSGTGTDLSFEISRVAASPATTVPLPAGGWLLLSGLVSLLGLQSRRKRSA